MKRQCAKCPWRVSTNPRDIPDGYCEAKHRNLAGTIAAPGAADFPTTLRLMACHHSKRGEEFACVGWLHHQLGVGNNIALRLAVLSGRIDAKYRLVGKQHPTFEDTLPREAK